MKTLALINGDLVVGQSGHATITGASRIRQDLSLALGEYWGTDRFHADQWGSVLIDYVGVPITEDIEFRVRSEVARVISNYIAIQDAQIYSDVAAGTRSRYATADVVSQVNSIKATVNYSKIRISIDLGTHAGAQIALNRTVTQ